MGKSILDADQFKDEAAAYAWVEARVWPNGRVCPHCGEIGHSSPMKGKSTRIGAYKCYGCRKPFTVKIGTIFEKSHIPMHIWLQAMFLIASSKKGISSNQLARTLGVTLKSAWFMSHRIREAMKDTAGGMFGAGGGGVEVDETYFGHDPDAPLGKKRNATNKNRVLTLVDRDSGKARSLMAPDFSIEGLRPILAENIAKEATLLTDEASAYKTPGKGFAAHKSVKHGVGEYVKRDDRAVHTNTVEGYFSVFKRGMRGVYQHCGKNHLHRYAAEFDFRYSHRAKLGVDDVTRFAKIVEGAKGKRLTYRRTNREAGAKA